MICNCELGSRKQKNQAYLQTAGVSKHVEIDQN